LSTLHSRQPGCNPDGRHAFEKHALYTLDRSGLLRIIGQVAILTAVIAEESIEWYSDFTIREALSLSPGAVLGYFFEKMPNWNFRNNIDALKELMPCFVLDYNRPVKIACTAFDGCS